MNWGKDLIKFTECEHKQKNEIDPNCINCNFDWAIRRIKILEDKEEHPLMSYESPTKPEQRKVSVEEINKIIIDTLIEFGNMEWKGVNRASQVIANYIYKETNE